MVNERKTEDIVREILKENKKVYEKETKGFVYIEEQKSDNPRIAKLLKNASKAGSGFGKPEFIVSFSNENLIIIIECKADTKKQRSENLDRPKDYAVDGAILYSSYLSKEFDVMALGVSGEDPAKLRVDTFLQIRGERTARDLNINTIYKFGEYIELLNSDPEKENADFNRLIKYSQTLNDKLRDLFDVEEILRPLIVSGILLALEDDSFVSSYQKKKTPKDVAEELVTTIKQRLEHDNIAETKRNTVVETYNFIRTNTNVINETNKDGSPNTRLQELIKDIDTNVRPFMKNHRYHDVIGHFYNEFLRYANGDGGLGIVLTPKHVTELFSELAQINKDSIVIDNCCGTGGFLISAMEKMEQDAKGDKDKIKEIHSKQLIGIENNPRMFCLAVSNMMLRGDGKANIFQDDTFNRSISDMRKFKATAAFLNPPYAKKSKDYKELAFVENALDFIEPNGTCIVILPESCAMNTDKDNLEIKRRILTKHTLKASMSMPNTLFEDSNTNAITCILVFEAHKPHNTSQKTWFAYWKDDGFIKVRPFGRIDYYHKFGDTIKKNWLDSYFNRSVIDGFSLLQSIKYDDEWLVEAYMKTDFESLKDYDFETTMRDYTKFLYSNNLAKNVSNESYSDTRLKIDFTKWKEIRLEKLFSVEGSRTVDKKVLVSQHNSGKYPYVTTQAENNGVQGFYDIYYNIGNVLTIDSATVGYCAYQPLNYSASDHVERLVPKFDLNTFRAMFLTTIINKEQYRYSFGRKFNQDRIKATVIKLPFKDGFESNNIKGIDWDFIESYIKGLNYSKYLEITEL